MSTSLLDFKGRPTDRLRKIVYPHNNNMYLISYNVQTWATLIRLALAYYHGIHNSTYIMFIAMRRMFFAKSYLVQINTPHLSHFIKKYLSHKFTLSKKSQSEKSDRVKNHRVRKIIVKT